MSDNSFEYITTDYMVSVNPIEDTQSPTVEYIVELGQQGLPGAKGEPGEPGFSPVVTSVIDDNTIRFTLVNKDEVTTTPNFYDLLAKKDLSNTTYADDMANKLDKDGANADSPITLNKLIITRGTTTTADVYLSTTNNRNISINAPIRTTNNIQLSPSGTTGTVTYKGHELATLNDIPEVPDVSNFLNKDGSNVASTISLQNVSLTGNIQTVQPNFYISNNKASNGNITINTFDGNIYLSPDSNHKLYYRNKEIATINQLPTVGNGVITIKQGDVTKGAFTTNQSGNVTIELDEGGGGTATDVQINGISITSNNVADIITKGVYNATTNKIATIADIPDISNFVTNTSLATTLASYVTSSSLSNTLSLYARKDQLEAVAFSGSYNDLANKPIIPTVGNGTITIQKNGSDIESFNLNQSTNETINITVPTQTSELTNDSNFATVSQIPTNNNQLTNGAGYITNSALNRYAKIADLATVATSGSYNDLTDKPTIPAAQVNADWNARSGLAQILNKPTIPTVGNGTVTINQGGTQKGTFTLNQSGNTTINLDAGGGGGVTNPITLSETIEGNTYSLSIGIDKTTGNLQGTYSYPVSGGTGTLPLFSRSYGLVNAGLSNNYTTVNGYQTNMLSVKVDNSTIGFNSNGALTVTGSYASTTDLNDKVSKSGDTMTGSLDIANQGHLAFQHDGLTKGTIPSATTYQEILFEDGSNTDTWQEKRLGYIQSKQYTDGRSSIVMGAIQNVANSDKIASIETWINQDGTTHCTFPNTDRVDGQWKSKVVDVVDSVTMNNTSRSVSVNSVLPNDGRIYEVLFNANARTGTTTGNYAILVLNGNIAGGCEVGRAVTRSASYATCGGSVIIPCRYGTNITLTINSNANVTNIHVTARAYRRVGINT